MIPEFLSMLGNHLWQSSLFAVGVWILALAFRKNSASVRYRLWLIASMKFLIPFSLLVRLGSLLEWRPASDAAPWPWLLMLDQANQAFPGSVAAPLSATQKLSHQDTITHEKNEK